MQDAACDNRIEQQLSGREEEFRQLFARARSEEVAVQEEAYGELEALPIGSTRQHVVKIELSWGGPADWLEVWVDQDGTVDHVRYHFADWFDHAERKVAYGTPLWRAADYYVEWVRSC